MPFTNTSVVEIVVSGQSTSGQQVLNVFHYRSVVTDPDTFTNVGLQNLVNNFQTNWIANILPVLSVDYKVLLYRGRALTGTIADPAPPPPTQFVVGEQFDKVAAGSEVGGKAGAVSPSFTAVGVQKLTDRAGRNFRGSFRLGTIQEVDVLGNQLEAGAFNGFVSAATLLTQAQLDIAFEGPFWEMAVLSRTLALAAPPPFTDLRSLTAKVLNGKVNTFITSQVSRKQSLTQPT